MSCASSQHALHHVQASELAFLHSCTLASGAKNYQLWNHRRRVALQLGALNIAEVRVPFSDVVMQLQGKCELLEPMHLAC
jgi:hypothetical protein